MKTTAEWIQIDEQRRKFVHQWEPQDSYRATFCLVHGLGEHGGRYHTFAEALVSAGFRVVAFDQQGHGQSPEKRGCIESYESMLQDIEAVLGWCAAQDGERPQILFGHSMGGNLSLNYALRELRQPAAVISSSPMIRASREPAKWFVAVGRLLLRFMPNFQMKSSPQVERLMSDPAEQERFRQDELFHSFLSLRLGNDLLETGVWALQNRQRLRSPLLLTHGTNDYLTSTAASQEFAAQANEWCEFHLFEGHLHDPFRDIGREAVIQRFVEFVHAKCVQV